MEDYEVLGPQIQQDWQSDQLSDTSASIRSCGHMKNWAAENILGVLAFLNILKK